MALTLKSGRLYRSFFITCRNYSQEKSIYEREEEGPKPLIVHGKKIVEWRKPWIQREGEWASKLSVFVEKNPNPNIILALSKLPNLTVEDVKEWWSSMKEIQEIRNQDFLPQRVATLGPNLGAVHFFLYRGCSVRLKGSTEWTYGTMETIEALPINYVEGYQVEAVDCSKFMGSGIRYEGIQNLSNLSYLKWLSLKGNKHVDVWCLDRVAGQNGKSLEHLDIRGCKLSVGCIFALSRMPTLKTLTLTDPGDNMELQAALSMLEEERPKLLIDTKLE